jgi:hypothetical protein
MYRGNRELEESTDGHQLDFTVDEEDYGYDMDVLQLKSEPKARPNFFCFGTFSENCKYLSQFCTDLHKN